MKAFERILTGFTAATVLAHAATGSGAAIAEHDMDVAEAKLAEAIPYFQKTWTDMFRSRGATFAAPRVMKFRGSVKTACGELKSGNSFFCTRDNTVYLDGALLALSMTRAAAALHTDGDYAAIVIGAHEYGHAVAAQFTVDRNEQEPMADCFAGVITRHAKTDGYLDAGDLAEGLHSLGEAGDYHQSSSPGEAVTQQIMGHILKQTHGSDEGRRAAFLEGYYGGANLCASLGELGATRPLPGGRVIKAATLVPPAAIGSGKGRLCTWSNGPAGLRVRNSAASGSCMLDLLNHEAQLPDHVRIELTVSGASAVNAGIYFGDAHSLVGPTRYGFEIRHNSFAQLVHIDSDTMIDLFHGLNSFLGRSKMNAVVENRLTLDIHHEGSDVYFIEYINGFAAGFGHWPGALSFRFGNRDEVGVWVRDPGAEAIFKDLRVTALFN